MLKVVDPELFETAKKGRLTYAQISEVLGLKTASVREGSREDWYVKWWKFCTGEAMDQAEEQNLSQSLWQYSIEKDEIIPHVANGVIDRLTPG